MNCYKSVLFFFAENRTRTGNRKRGKRKLFTPKTRKIVLAWYTKNRTYPYPTEDEVTQLAEEANITRYQVIRWMSNKRLRTNNTLTNSGAMHPKMRQKKLLTKEAKENPAAAARRATAKKFRE